MSSYLIVCVTEQLSSVIELCIRQETLVVMTNKETTCRPLYRRNQNLIDVVDSEPTAVIRRLIDSGQLGTRTVI